MNLFRFVFNALSVLIYTCCFIVAAIYFFLRFGSDYTFDTADLLMFGVGAVMLLLAISTIRAMQRSGGEKRI